MSNFFYTFFRIEPEPQPGTWAYVAADVRAQLNPESVPPVFEPSSWDSTFPSIASSLYWLPFMHLGLVLCIVIMLSVFLPREGVFIRFLHKVTFMYLFLVVWTNIGLSTSPIAHLQQWEGIWNGDPLLSEGFSYAAFKDALTWDWQQHSIFFSFFALIATLSITVLLVGLIDRYFIGKGGEMEFVVLVLVIHLGAFFVLKSFHFIDILLALETITLASYALVSFERTNRFSPYGGIQYFLLGSIPSGLLLLGFALVYHRTGTIVLQDLDLFSSPITFDRMWVEYPDFKEFYEHTEDHWVINADGEPEFRKYLCIVHDARGSVPLFFPSDAMEFKAIHKSPALMTDVNWAEIVAATAPQNFASVVGAVLIAFNLLFKLTSAPFHFWAPTVYGKAPLATTTFLSIFSKLMVLFLLIKLFFGVYGALYEIFSPFFLFCGVLSVIIGLIGAFTETITKRFFVYSSMGHVGFMLAGLSVWTTEGIFSVFHYLPVYILSSFIMWFLLLHMSKEKSLLTQLSSLRINERFLALFFALLVFSMSGIPPLGGFFVKVDILLILLESSQFFVTSIFFILIVASFFYYLRLIKIMFFDVSQENEVKNNEVALEGSYRLWVISFFTFLLLFYMLLVQKPLLALESEILASMF